MASPDTVNVFFLLAGMALGAGITGVLVAIQRLKERVRQLEQATRKRLPWRSADEIEDATAALLSLMLDADMKQEKVRNALAHLQRARNPEKAPGDAD